MPNRLAALSRLGSASSGFEDVCAFLSRDAPESAVVMFVAGMDCALVGHEPAEGRVEAANVAVVAPLRSACGASV